MQDTQSDCVTLALDLCRQPRWSERAYLCWSMASFGQLTRTRDQFLDVSERALDRDWAPRRQLSFLRGRRCAKQALGQLCLERDLTAFSILPGVFGQPVVHSRKEAHAEISIAHTDALAVALAFPKGHPMAVDVEQVTTENAAVIRQQLTVREWDLARNSFDSEQEAAVLCWVMKEALAKVLLTGLTTPIAIYEIAELSSAGTQWECLFKNFMQYKAHAFFLAGHVCAFVCPKNTKLKLQTNFGVCK